MNAERDLTLIRGTKGISKKTGYTRQHINILEERGDFPRRIQLGPNSVAWLQCEVDAWLLKKIQQRNRRRVRLD